ncbi:MAG: VOC family protein [Williamsia sp.]|nr:VOC family protein [Williamsia sp.]
MNQLTPFHVAIPVYDIEEARTFYREVLQCSEGRSDTHWTDFNLYGHQFVIHLKPKPAEAANAHHNPVDGHDVPVPHYGVVLPWDEWHQLESRLRSFNIKFVIEPYIRFEGKPGEQATMFFLDPSGNALEFKAFKDIGQLFAV